MRCDSTSGSEWRSRRDRPPSRLRKNGDCHPTPPPSPPPLVPLGARSHSFFPWGRGMLVGGARGPAPPPPPSPSPPPPLDSRDNRFQGPGGGGGGGGAEAGF